MYGISIIMYYAYARRPRQSHCLSLAPSQSSSSSLSCFLSLRPSLAVLVPPLLVLLPVIFTSSLRPSVFCLLLPLSYASLFLRSFSLFLLVLLLMLLFLLLLLLTHVEVVALIVTLLLVLIGGCASVFLLPS